MTTSNVSLAAVCGLCAALTASACLDLPPDDTTAFESTAQSIVGGDVEDGHPAVGALTWFGEPFCTGTLVRSNLVITAAHCIEGGAEVEGFGFFLGTDALRGRGTTVPVASMHRHPRYGQEGDNDIAVLVLARSAPVEPVDFLTTSMGSEWIGRRPLFVGFGTTNPKAQSGGIKRSVSIPIEEVDGTRFLYASSRANTCFGDSGGPALFRQGERWTLIGVTSWGDEDCAQFGVNARVDPYLDFIGQFLDGPLPEPADDDFDEDDLGDDDFDEDDLGDEGFDRGCDPEFWDDSCDEALGDFIDDLESLLDGEGGRGGCATITPGSRAPAPLRALWVAVVLVGLATRRRFM